MFTRRALTQMHLAGLHLQGYGFQIETVYQCHQDGLRIHEYPIRFLDRQLGHSKMSRAIVLEALLYVFRRRFTDIYHRLSRRDEPPNVGDHHHATEYAYHAHDNVQPRLPLRLRFQVRPA